MSGELRAGLSTEVSTKVSQDMVIDFLGEGGEVLSTPAMVNLIEQTCRKMLKPYLRKDEDSLGIRIDVKHLAATPLGMDVKVKALLAKIDGRKFTFNVEAFDEKEKIGEAVHERFVVDKTKFLDKLRKKIQS